MTMRESVGDLTWPALLGFWTDFARSSLALPRDAEGDRWRAAVAPIIGLQAVAFAMGDLDRLSAGVADERALALDRAEMLIERHAGELSAIWAGQELHPELRAIIADAHAARVAAAEAGVEWVVTSERLVAPHPAELVEALLGGGFTGDLHLPSPGVPLFAGAPAAFARTMSGARPGADVEEAVGMFLLDGGARVAGPERVKLRRQVYRQFDFARGGPVRDLVAAAAAGEQTGQPLLVAAIRTGRAEPVTLPPRRAADVPALPVVALADGAE